MTLKKPYLSLLIHGPWLEDMHLSHDDQPKKRMGNIQSHMPVIGPAFHQLIKMRNTDRERQPLEELAALFLLLEKRHLMVAGL